MRSKLDAAALAEIASRPGSDPRVWLCDGYVTDLGFDAREGVFADVYLNPAGPEVTCYVAMPYAGDGFGDHCPLKVKDTVLVAIPRGDGARGPWVIGRSWNSGDKPPSQARSKVDPREPSDERVIVVEANQNCRIVVSGTGDVIVEAQGTGKVRLGAEQGTLPLAIAPNVEARLQALELRADTHVHTVAVPGGVTGPQQVIPPELGAQAGAKLMSPIAAQKVEGV